MEPCPFCGEKSTSYIDSQGTKWGCVVCNDCGAWGPEVRTGYDLSENAEWHKDADREWNIRPESYTYTQILAACENHFYNEKGTNQLIEDLRRLYATKA